jgi:hypothetical protein
MKHGLLVASKANNPNGTAMPFFAGEPRNRLPGSIQHNVSPQFWARNGELLCRNQRIYARGAKRRDRASTRGSDRAAGNTAKSQYRRGIRFHRPRREQPTTSFAQHVTSRGGPKQKLKEPRLGAPSQKNLVLLETKVMVPRWNTNFSTMSVSF